MKTLFVAVLAVLLTAACLSGPGMGQASIELTGTAMPEGVLLEWEPGPSGMLQLFASPESDPLTTGEQIFISTKPWLHDNYFHERLDDHYFIAKVTTSSGFYHSNVVVIP